MNTITQETRQFHPLEHDVPAGLAKGKGSELHSTYFEFRVTLPVVVGIAVSEMSDEELLVAAEKAGTFEFLNAPEDVNGGRKL